MPKPNSNAKIFTFEDNKTVSDLKAVPEQYRSLYSQNGENYDLTPPEGSQPLITGIDTVARGLASERTGRKADKDRIVDLSPLSEYGTSPEEIKASFTAKVEELQTQITGEGDAKLNLEKIKEDIKKAHSIEMQSAADTIKGLQGQIYNYEFTNQAQAAIATQGAAQYQAPLLLAMKPFIREKTEDGKHKVVVVDEEGNIRYNGGTQAEMTVAELVGEMKSSELYAHFFPSDKPKGPGLHDNNPKPATFTPKTTEKKSSHDKKVAGLQARGYK